MKFKLKDSLNSSDEDIKGVILGWLTIQILILAIWIGTIIIKFIIWSAPGPIFLRLSILVIISMVVTLLTIFTIDKNEKK